MPRREHHDPYEDPQDTTFGPFWKDAIKELDEGITEKWGEGANLCKKVLGWLQKVGSLYYVPPSDPKVKVNRWTDLANAYGGKKTESAKEPASAVRKAVATLLRDNFSKLMHPDCPRPVFLALMLGFPFVVFDFESDPGFREEASKRVLDRWKIERPQATGAVDLTYWQFWLPVNMYVPSGNVIQAGDQFASPVAMEARMRLS